MVKVQVNIKINPPECLRCLLTNVIINYNVKLIMKCKAKSLGSAAYTGWLPRLDKSLPFFCCSAPREAREMNRTKPLRRDWVINVFRLFSSVITLTCCQDCLFPTDTGIIWCSYVCNWELTSFTANGTNEVLAHYLQLDFYVLRY